MIFPKPLMSITEMVELGFSRETLQRYSHVKDFPHMRTIGDGKILIFTDEFLEWERNFKKKTVSKRR